MERARRGVKLTDPLWRAKFRFFILLASHCARVFVCIICAGGCHTEVFFFLTGKARGGGKSLACNFRIMDFARAHRQTSKLFRLNFVGQPRAVAAKVKNL